MQVQTLAKQVGVTADTVRFYTRIGYLKPGRAANGYKQYQQSDVARLRFIVAARGLGFSVEDIGNMLSEARKGKTPCGMARELIAQRLEEVEQRYRDIAELRARLQRAVAQWSRKPDRAPTGDSICYLIETFESEASCEETRHAMRAAGD